jgi:hypothetical protein
VVAHVVGITADLNALRLGEGHTSAESWTDEQVHSRRGRPMDDLGSEWEHEAGQFEEGLRLLGYEIGSHYVGDLLHHAQDIRSALGTARISDDEALVAGLDFYLDAFHEALTQAGAGSVVVRFVDESWTLGAGPVAASLSATRFETFRALGGRRSVAQIRSLGWTGDVDSVLGSTSAYPPPLSDLVDP